MVSDVLLLAGGGYMLDGCCGWCGLEPELVVMMVAGVSALVVCEPNAERDRRSSFSRAETEKNSDFLVFWNGGGRDRKICGN